MKHGTKQITNPNRNIYSLSHFHLYGLKTISYLDVDMYTILGVFVDIYWESDDATGGASCISRKLILEYIKNCSFLFKMIGRTNQIEIE
jgi:hypothetical protein